MTDNNNQNSFADRTVTVSAPVSQNQAPVPSLSLSTTSANTNTTVSFNASNSFDPDGSITTYRWDFGDGNTSNNSQTTHSYRNPGNYKVSLRVTDNNNQDSYADRTVTILAPAGINQAPVANFTTNGNNITLGQSVAVNAQNSFDPDGSINRYNWNFGDGNADSGLTAEHIYQSAGNYRITLTITDNNNVSSTTSRTVSVVEDTQVETSGNEEEDSNSENELPIETGGHLSLYALLLLVFSLISRRARRARST